MLEGREQKKQTQCEMKFLLSGILIWINVYTRCVFTCHGLFVLASDISRYFVRYIKLSKPDHKLLYSLLNTSYFIEYEYKEYVFNVFDCEPEI